MGSYSSSSTSSDSLNGLKFGQKIYFEDVVGTDGINPTKSGGGGGGGTSLSAGDAPPASPAKKGRFGGGGVSHGGQPPRCQVEGCNVDLSDAKGYYARHKVCIMHSKSGKVIVSGNEQRFCQQCSRFHQLSEFDQEKRSCRRRLAGHNERRRKPPPGSLLSTRYGSLSSSVYENNSGAGSFLMDFTSYPKPTWRDQWTSSRASEQVSGNQQPEFGRFLPWQSNSSESPQPEIQASATSNPYNISSGGCFTGVSDSSCALSLLSNQPCNSKGQSSSLGANYELDTHGAHIVQTTGVHAATIGHFPSSSWDYKSNESGTSSVNMHSDLGLGQITQPGNRGYAGDLQLNQQRGRPFMNHEHSKAYYSTHDMHWLI